MFRMAACRYAAMLIVEPMLREYTVDTIYQTTDLDTIYSLLAKRCERDPDDLVAQPQLGQGILQHRPLENGGLGR